jgi:pimeloyl-ACP methyl ester carboxylesterase
MLLHAKVFGEKQDKLIILHGLFGMLDNWQSLARKFAEHYQVHILDQRNHGHSFHSDSHSYELMAEDLKAYLDHHQIDKIHLMGHSMGGKTAMLFANLYPEMVDKLIVIDIAPKYYPPHHQDIIRGLQDVEQANISSRKEADAIMQKHFSNLGVRQFLLKNLYWKTKTDLVFRFNLKSLVENIENVGVPLPANTRFSNPTLFISGEKSNYILEEDEDLISEHFPDFELMEIADAGHWVHAEKPEALLNMVLQFLIF